MGEAVGAGFEVGVGESAVLEDDGGGVGEFGGPAGEEGGQGDELALPQGEFRYGRAFVVEQDIEPAEARLRFGDSRLQYPDPAREEPFHGVRVEQVGGELHVSMDARAVPLQQVERQVEHGRGRVHRHDLGLDAGEFEGPAGYVLERQQHLEQGLPGQRARRVEGLDQVLERQLLVVVGGEGRLPYAAQELGERRVAGRVGAQDQGVHKEAHEVVERLVGAARDEAAHGDVVACAELVQQRGKTGLEHHEEARALTAAEVEEPDVQVGVQLDADLAPLEGGRGRSGPVGGELDLVGELGEGARPVGGLAREEALRVPRVTEELLLPERVVAVLHGEFGPVGGLARATCRVRRREIAVDRAEGPAVARDVVDGDEEDVDVGPVGEQVGAQGRLGRQVEGAGQGGGEVHAFGDREVGAVFGQDVLVRNAVHVREDGAQALVTVRQVCESRFEGGAVEGSGQAPGQRDVVRRAAAVQPVQEPEPALGRRQGQAFGPGGRDERRAGLARRTEARGDPGDGRGLEERPQFKFHAERGADPGDESGGQQRVAAEVEEVVVRADLGDAEHLREQVAQDLFTRGARRAARLRRREVGRGQGGAVQLAVHGQRQGIQGDERGRDHVLGEASAQVGAEVVRCRAPHHVRDEPCVVGAVLPGEYGDLRDLGVRGEGRLDLTQLDPESPDFDLVVRAPGVLQHPVRPPPDQVTGAVHPRAGPAERVGDETFRAQPRPVQIPPGEPGTGDVQLPHHAGRDELQMPVQDVSPQVRDRGTDDAGRLRKRGGVEGLVRDVHGRLGDAVHVDQGRSIVRVVGVPVRQAGGLQGLPAEDHISQGEAGGVGRELVEGRRGLVEDRHAFLGQQRRERLGVAGHVVVHDHQPAAVQQCAPQLPDGEVERVRMEQRPHVIRTEPEPLVRGAEQPHHVGVRDQHALGAAGRAGGVDDVRRVVRQDPYAGVGVGIALPHHAQVVQNQRRLGVLDHELPPCGGVVGVQRHIRGAGLEDAEDGYDEVGGAGQGEGDEVLRPDAPFEEPVGQTVGAGVEFAVRQSVRARDDGHRVGVLPRLCLEDGHDVAARCRDRSGQECSAFRGQQDVDLAQPDPGVGDAGPKDPDPAVHHALDGFGVVEVARELHEAVDAFGFSVVRVAFGHGEDEIQLGGGGGELDGTGGESRRGEVGPGRVLEDQHHLEQRVVGEGAGRVEGLDEVLERQVLVGVGGEGDVADAGEEVGEGGVARGVAAQDEGVDEVADQVVERLVGAAGDEGADGEVLARAELVEEPGESGVQDHEEAGAVRAGQLAQLVVEFGVESDPDEPALVGGDGRAGPVGGELDLFGEPGEGLRPVGGLASEEAIRVPCVAEELVLPERVVGVLDGELGPHRFLAPAAGRVRVGEVLGERAEGPAVARDVMDHQQQDVFTLGDLEQLDVQGEFDGQVEGVPKRLGEDGVQRVLGEVPAPQREARLVRVQDPLVRDAVELRVDGPQALVAHHDVGECGLQRRPVQGALEPPGQRDVVVGALALQLVQEPQASLGERQRDQFRAGRRGVEGEAGLSGGGEASGEPCGGRGLEQGAQFEFHAEGDADPGDEAGREE
ncbi:hypothetical protein a10_08578 [Streptomyces acidiscabies]|nr:hypothetical protein a10_08578 [Streptomyces acidiscabies]GAV45534.1 hypothetical protein Saa2_08525 [Streptomyces acidiscabies]